MGTLSHLVLKALKRAYGKVSGNNNRLALSELGTSPDEASDLIYKLLMSEKPCMVARFGANELNMVCNYLSIISKHHSAIKFITGKEAEWWWNHKQMQAMQNNAGFFPADEVHLTQFCELMLEDAKNLDVLGRWIRDEEE